MPSTSDLEGRVFFDAGLFIGALLEDDVRHLEARPFVETARAGGIQVVTCAGLLCEVYAALTWEKATPRHEPQAAAEAVKLLVEPPSAIEVLESKTGVTAFAVEIAAANGLTGRRVHDAHHAAIALLSGIYGVFTYDIDDWEVFRANGLRIVGPPSVLERLEARKGA